jgi:hypothetical protein
MAEKTNLEKRSCFIEGNSKGRRRDENKAAERNMTPAALPRWVRIAKFPVAITLSLSCDAATKLAR